MSHSCWLRWPPAPPKTPSRSRTADDPRRAYAAMSVTKFGISHGYNNWQNMEVFISYSSKNKNVADAVCHVLEENNITCWIAPRDVQTGITYAKQIIHAIKDCLVFVLIFSKEANVSEHVGNEVDCAFKNNKPIIPFAIDEASVNEELDYYLSRRHWLIAYPDYREKTKDLVVSVKKLLETPMPLRKSALVKDNHEGVYPKSSYSSADEVVVIGDEKILFKKKLIKILKDGRLIGQMAPNTQYRIPIENDCVINFKYGSSNCSAIIRKGIDTMILLMYSDYAFTPLKAYVANEETKDDVRNIMQEKAAKAKRIFIIIFGIIILAFLIIILLAIFLG